MTTNTLPRFTAHSGVARCMGTNHRDSARKGSCGRCGRDVVKTDKGRILDINSRINAGDRHVEDYACWQREHECDTVRSAYWQAQHDAAIERGELVYGQNVIVARGRKIAKGTIGVIRHVDLDNAYGPRVGISVDGVAGLQYTAMKNCDVHTPVTVDDCLDALAGVNMPTPGADDFKPVVTMSAARSNGSHAVCSHAATKSARAACRKARTNA